MKSVGPQRLSRFALDWFRSAGPRNIDICCFAARPAQGVTCEVAAPIVNDRTKGTTVRTFTPNQESAQADRAWHVIDATDVVLGRLASQTAALLRGKHKPTFAPHIDTGDFVIIINADKIALTGAKAEQKRAYRHSGHPGGLSSMNYTEMLEKHPTRAVEKAVRGMLPRNSLGRQQLSKLKVYAGAEHPHQAQQPKPYEFTQVAQ